MIDIIINKDEVIGLCDWFITGNLEKVITVRKRHGQWVIDSQTGETINLQQSEKMMKCKLKALRTVEILELIK